MAAAYHCITPHDRERGGYQGWHTAWHGHEGVQPQVRAVGLQSQVKATGVQPQVKAVTSVAGEGRGVSGPR
jgi:hypothetical protein